MSEHDAVEGEMGFLGGIHDEDAELLLAGRAPRRGGAQLEEVASFVDAVRAAVPAPPDPREETFMVRQLAATARSASQAATAETVPMAAVPGAGWRPRLALLARVAVAVAVVPAAMAGLAVAGVRLPEPAREALNTVGVELPNQSEEDSVTSGDENGGDEGAASRSGGGGSGGNADGAGNGEPTKQGHGHRKDHGRGHGNGNAHGNGHGGGQGEGSAGSQGGGGGPTGVPPGQGGIPPGQGATPPGQAAPPPGQGGTPPGQGGAIPGSGSGGQSAEPHGGGSPGDVPPGQAKLK